MTFIIRSERTNDFFPNTNKHYHLKASRKDGHHLSKRSKPTSEASQQAKQANKQKSRSIEYDTTGLIIY